MLKQTATKKEIKLAKKRAGKGKHTLVLSSLADLSKVNKNIYNR